MKYLLQGFTMGLAYVAPIGVQNLFVINTALTQKKRRAFLTAIIVIFFDITLALACFLGIGTIMEKSKLLEWIILLLGSIIVIYIGFGLIKLRGKMDNSTDVNIPLKKVIATACIVTWFNPQAIIDGSMMLGAFRASLPVTEGVKFIIGVTGASTIWFLGVTLFITIFSNKFNDNILTWINRICGIIIIFYGFKLLYSFVEKIF